MTVPRDPGHKKGKPRGSGTYWARVYCRCGSHGTHDIVFSAADDDSWVVAQWLAHSLHEYAHSDVRCLIWHVKDTWRPPNAADVRSDQIEDDIPF